MTTSAMATTAAVAAALTSHATVLRTLWILLLEQ
jgi:hypothetical protein